MYVFFIFTFILVLYRVLNLWNTIRTRQTLVLVLKDCVFAWPLTFLAWYRHLNKNLYAWQWNCINADHIAKVWGLTVYSHVENTCMVHVQSLQTKITCIMLLTGDIQIHNPSLTLPLFIKMFVSSHDSERSCICALGASFLSLWFFSEIVELLR
jgi:hypothetical protein